MAAVSKMFFCTGGSSTRLETSSYLSYSSKDASFRTNVSIVFGPERSNSRNMRRVFWTFRKYSRLFLWWFYKAYEVSNLSSCYPGWYLITLSNRKDFFSFCFRTISGHSFGFLFSNLRRLHINSFIAKFPMSSKATSSNAPALLPVMPDLNVGEDDDVELDDDHQDENHLMTILQKLKSAKRTLDSSRQK